MTQLPIDTSPIFFEKLRELIQQLKKEVYSRSSPRVAIHK